MPQVAGADDRLLTGEAALRVGNGLRRPVNLHREIVFVNIDAVDRRSRLDAQRVERLLSCRHGTLSQESVPKLFGGCRRDQQIETRKPQRIVAADVEGRPSRSRELDMLERPQVGKRRGKSRFENCLRSRPGQMNLRKVPGAVEQFKLLANQEMIEVLQRLRRLTRRQVEPDRLHAFGIAHRKSQ